MVRNPRLPPRPAVLDRSRLVSGRRSSPHGARSHGGAVSSRTPRRGPAASRRRGLDELEVAAVRRRWRGRRRRRACAGSSVAREALWSRGRSGARRPRAAVARGRSSQPKASRSYGEVGEELAPARPRIEVPGVELRAWDLGPPLAGVDQPRGRFPRRDEYLPRSRAAEVVPKPVPPRGPVHSATTNSPVVASSQAAPEADPRPRWRAERRLAGVEGRRLELRARRHHPDDFAPHHPLGGARVLHLLAERDPEALLDQAPDVGGARVVGDAAHGDRRALLVLGARGEGDVQRARRGDRVLEEQLVEVAHAEEQQRARVLRLHPVVRLHRGGGGDRGGAHRGSGSPIF